MKIEIDVNKDGYSVTYKAGEYQHTEKHVRTALGSKCVEGDFENEEKDISEEAYDALNDIKMACFDIMTSLR